MAWAASIRYHAGRYWVYFNTPDEGFFMTSAPSPTGPWEPLHALWRTSGWNDVCPFCNDDGQGYLVTTRYADAYMVHLQAVHGREVTGRPICGHPLFSEVKSEGRVLMMNRAPASTARSGPDSCSTSTAPWTASPTRADWCRLRTAHGTL
ncbi:family 43 glycosylhydrolase [Micromonospora sp. KC721]|uniref:family 43 glycosylhydrolase n=1 Tax=Micromonospora sp. KC721 TaxID=2530380 RepID=UPI001A9EDB25